MVVKTTIKPQIKSDRSCRLEWLGRMDYQQAWDYQRSLLNARLTAPDLDDILLLLEHNPVYTLGTGAKTEFVKFTLNQYELHRVERGGEVTYHCPGQLVGYPILNLRHYQMDLHWYLRQLESVILRVLQGYGLMGERIEGLTGVWVQGYKVAAIGIKVSRWITMHGFAINVCPDLSGFQQIVPCGIRDRPVGSLIQFLPEINFDQVRFETAIAFAEVFGVRLID